MRKLFLLGIMALILSACSEENEETQFTNFTANHGVKKSCKMKSQSARSSYSDEYEVDAQLYEVTGFDSKVSKNRRTVSLSESAAEKYGLHAGLYIMENQLLRKVVQLNGKDFFDETSDSCGLRPITSSYGEIDGAASEERGYSVEYHGTSVVLKTYVRTVLSSSSGQSVNRYYPCNPNEVKWKYWLADKF